MFRTPWDPDPAPDILAPLPEPVPLPPKKRGRRPTPKPESDRDGAGEGRWLYHHLTITGPAGRVAAFAEAAQGAGIVPWRLDGDRIEEDIFHLAVSQPKAMRSLTVAGCRILARQFRERVEDHAARAAALVGQSRACPFDLQHPPAGAGKHPVPRADPSESPGLAVETLGSLRRAATGGAAVAGDGRQTAAGGSHSARLRILHGRRHAARGHRADRRRLAGPALRAAAAARGMSGSRLDRSGRPAPGLEGHGMGDSAHPSVLDGTADDDASWENEGPPVRVPATGAPAAGTPSAPILHLDGFDGPMDLLLDLVERQRIDLGRMSILILVEQFLAGFDQMRDRVALERRADWLVMATRLVLLRSRLLFPESPAAAAAAARDAATALRRIDDLAGLRAAAAQAAAAWLGARPILGQEVFARGLPEQLGVHRDTAHTVDVIAFLWASLSFFEDDAPEPDTVTRYRPSWTELYPVAEARERILRILGEGGDGKDLGQFLPEHPASTAAEDPSDPLRLSSAWATTFSASLELAKQGDVALAQDTVFADIQVSRPSGPGPSGPGPSGPGPSGPRP